MERRVWRGNPLLLFLHCTSTSSTEETDFNGLLCALGLSVYPANSLVRRQEGAPAQTDVYACLPAYASNLIDAQTERPKAQRRGRRIPTGEHLNL